MDEEICTHDGIEDASDCPHATRVEFALEDADISNPPQMYDWLWDYDILGAEQMLYEMEYDL